MCTANFSESLSWGFPGIICFSYCRLLVKALVFVICSLQPRTSSLGFEHAPLCSVGKSPTNSQGKGPTKVQGKRPIRPKVRAQEGPKARDPKGPKGRTEQVPNGRVVNSGVITHGKELNKDFLEATAKQQRQGLSLAAKL